MNATIESPEAALTRARTEVLTRCVANPYLGYDSFGAAVEDAKFSSQVEALARLFSGKNIFLSGPAGSGKTYLIEQYIEWLDAEYEGRVNVAVTASTGIAAQLLGGRTIHSWSGIGINNETFKQPTPTEWSKRDFLESVDVLIIDEISMLPGYLFTRLDALLRYMRKSKEPFGGVQLIVMGDFMQLPPVGRKGEMTKDGELLDNGFCIKTEAWKKASFRALYLDKVRRAKDPKLKRVLASIAADKVDERTRSLVESRLGAPKDPKKKYMTLFTTNKNVDKFNDERLAENPNPERRITPEYLGNPKHWDLLKKSHGILEACRVKIGATVMLTANIKDGHANGSLGEVKTIESTGCLVLFNDGTEEFIGYKEYSHTEKVLVRVDKRKGKDVEVFEDQIVSTILAVPLKLGYAISVHKSQGQTFSAVEVDLSFVFSAGLGYVALSRVSSLDDLVLIGNRIHPDTYRVDQESFRFSKATKKAALGRRHEMLRNMEETAAHLSKVARTGDTEPVEVIDVAETVNVEPVPVSTVDPFAMLSEQEDPFEGAGSITIPTEDPNEVEAEEAQIPIPLGFLSYEQLLTNPHTRSVIWEKKVTERKRRVERAAARR